MRRISLTTIALAPCLLLLAGCDGGVAPKPEAIRGKIFAARDEAKAAQEKKDSKAAGAAADRADKLLADLRKLAKDGPVAKEAGACLAESEQAAGQARYWAELADEEHRLAEKVGSLKAKAYRAGRAAALTALFKGLALAADQAGKQGLDKLPKPAQDAANYAAELSGRAPLPDGSPDWAGVSADMDALAKSLPPGLRMMMAAGMVLGAQDNFAIYEAEAIDLAALASPEDRVCCRGLRGWVYSLQGYRHLAAREFEAADAEQGLEAGRSREIVAIVHLFMAMHMCAGKDFAKADLELARAVKVMPDPWFATIQEIMAKLVEHERLVASGQAEKGEESLLGLGGMVDGEWLARRLAQRAEEVRSKKDKAGPLFGDPAFKRDLIIHLAAKAAKDSPVAKKLKGWLDAAGGLGRRFLEVMPGGGEKMKEPEATSPKFNELSKDDAARLERQRAVVAAEAKKRYGTAGLKKTKEDLAVLQRLLDDQAFAKTQTYELQSLGVVLGDVLCAELPLRWVMVTDEYGTDPTLRFKETTCRVNPITMISKRIERGDKVDAAWLLDQTAQSLPRIEKELQE